MMSSSEVQRITLSGKKIVSPNGSIDLEDWDDDDESEKADENKTEDGDENTTVEATTPISAANSENAVNQKIITNGVESSPTNNFANETITSSIGSVGDITIDSVRDHLNSTVTTLCSQTTEEIIGRLSVLSTTTNNSATSLKPKEVLDVKTLKETIAGETNETHQNSVIVKSVITTISHGAGATNGDAEKTTTTTITRKESQF